MSPAQSAFQIADLVEEVGSLPTVAAQVVALTSDPDCDLEQLTQVIMSDGVLTMRFLAVANSAAMSRGREIRDLRPALVRLGMRRVRNLALCMGMHDMMPSRGGAGGLDRLDLWRFTLGAASCARGLARLHSGINPDDMYLMGLLHTIGIAALDQKAGPEFQTTLSAAQEARCPLTAAEPTVFGFHHAELGARILNNWNLPGLFAQVVRLTPIATSLNGCAAETATLVAVLRDAIAITRATGTGNNGDGDPPPALADLAVRLEIADDALHLLAEQVDEEVDAMARALGLDLPHENLFREAVTNSRQEIARLGLEGIDEAFARNELEAEMASARDIQQRLLPGTMPVLPYGDIAAINRPSRRVSGDYYDFIAMRGGGIGLVVADVSGKGMPASLLASNLQASLRALATVYESPGELLAAANTALFDSTDPDKFATLFLARLDAEQRRLVYASAGHNPPLLLHADGRAEWLKPDGTPLGMVQQMAYPQTEVPLVSGDVLVIYTDGVTEARDSADSEFTETGLEAAVRASAQRSPALLVEAIQQAVYQHADPAAAGASPLGTAGADQEVTAGQSVTDAPEADWLLDDDLTVIVLKID